MLLDPNQLSAQFSLDLGLNWIMFFSSKWLLMELNRLRFCIGSDEVARYKQSIVENENVTDFLCENLSGSFTPMVCR